MKKKMLLIAGGGTLGRYTAQQLTADGCEADILCLEDHAPRSGVQFIRMDATADALARFLQDRYYDGIVNFIHYTSVDAYRPVHALLSQKTDHLVFLSSYRVYADLQHPITEEAPLLLDTVDDDEFVRTEGYAVPKTQNERFIRTDSGTDNWTIVRPVISFSDLRLDIVTRSGHEVVTRTRAGQEILLPRAARGLTAGLDWAGNSGKLIARLLQNPAACGETYTVSSAQNRTWGEVASYYTECIGARFAWVDTADYLHDQGLDEMPYGLKYDRLYDRAIDNRKVLDAAGCTAADFTSIRDGIRMETDRVLRGGTH